MKSIHLGVTTQTYATEIATLLNAHNSLHSPYDAERILKTGGNFLFAVEDGIVAAAIEVKKTQWYQAEVRHLSVAPGYRHRGLGRLLLQTAEDAAKVAGVCALQCTIRLGNTSSELLFMYRGFKPVNSFVNPPDKQPHSHLSEGVVRRTVVKEEGR